MATVLADVFIRPARSVIVRTTPGREVKFFGGQAKITDHRDMPHMLAMPDARVIPTEAACSWAEYWLKDTREIKATVEWPDGWTVEHTNQDEFSVNKPEGEFSITYVPLTVSPPEPAKFGGPSLIDSLLAPAEDPLVDPPAEPEPSKPKARSRRK